MERKSSIGLRVFGTSVIIYGSYFLYVTLGQFIFFWKDVLKEMAYSLTHKNISFSYGPTMLLLIIEIIILIGGVGCIICGIEVLRLKPRARKSLLFFIPIIAILFLFRCYIQSCTLAVILPFLITIFVVATVLLIYFTRPQVKAQFK